MRKSAVGEMNTNYILEYFAGSFTKEKVPQMPSYMSKMTLKFQKS